MIPDTINVPDDLWQDALLNESAKNKRLNMAIY